MAGPTNTGITDEEIKRRDEEREIQLNQDDPKEALSAGLNEDEIGMNALSQSELSDPTDPRNHPGAQTAQSTTDELDSTDPGYASGHDSMEAQLSQYNTAMAGASEGRHEGTMFDILSDRKRYIELQKKEDIRRAAMTTAILTLSQFKDAVNDIADRMTQREAEAVAILAAADECETELHQRIGTLEDRIRDEEAKLDIEQRKFEAMQAGANRGEVSPEELAEQQDIVTGLTGSLESAKGQLDFFTKLDERMKDLRETYDDAATAARQEMDSINNLIENGEEVTPAMMERLERLEGLEADALKALGGVDAGEKLATTLMAHMDAKILEGQQVPAEAAAFLMTAAEDGFVSKEEFASLLEHAPKPKHNPNDPNFNPAEMQQRQEEFLNIIKESGVQFESESGEYVGGQGAVDFLQAEMKKLQQEMSETRDDIAEATVDKSELQQQIADLQAQRSTQQATLNEAQSALNKEVAETAEIKVDAAGANAGMMEYDNVFDYMSQNYGYMGMGAGEDVSALATQENRMLKDTGGNLVYVNPETQMMYTLQKDANGDVARNADGEQIKVAVSPEDTADLYRDMFENKLLPRNFVPDGDGVMGFGKVEGAISEYSEHDGFGESITKSMVPSYGTKDQFQQLIADSVAAQEAEQALKAQELADAQGDVTAAQSAVSSATAALAATDSEILRLQNQLAEQERRKQELLDQGAEDLDAPALKTSDEMQLTLQDVYKKVDGTSGSDLITREDLDQALGPDASPEFRAQVEAALERDGVQIQEPDDSDIVVNTDLSEVDLASTNIYLAAFPFLGIGPFQYEPIQTPLFQPDPNGIYPASNYESFADSLDFASTNPSSGPEPSYLDPINNGTSNVPSAGETFGLAMTNQLNTQSQGGVSAEEALRLQREEELRMATNNPANQGGGGGMLT